MYFFFPRLLEIWSFFLWQQTWNVSVLLFLLILLLFSSKFIAKFNMFSFLRHCSSSNRVKNVQISVSLSYLFLWIFLSGVTSPNQLCPCFSIYCLLLLQIPLFHVLFQCLWLFRLFLKQQLLTIPSLNISISL